MNRALLRAALDQAEEHERGDGPSRPPRAAANGRPGPVVQLRGSRMTARFKVGDRVVRRRRLLKTQGILLRFDGVDQNRAARAWIKWNHPKTLPNPSLEPVDDLDLVA